MSIHWAELNYAVHPGEILKDYMEDAGYSQVELAKKIGINKIMLNEIINGKRPISTKTAILLEKAFSFDARFWSNLQLIYDEAVERLKLNQPKETFYATTIIDVSEKTNNILEHPSPTYTTCGSINLLAA